MSPIQTRQILFVDDDPLQADLGKRVLEAVGYSVDVETSPLAALANISENPGRYDAVITDYRMPELVGIGLAQEIREIRSDIPILLVTGDAAVLKQTGEMRETFDAVIAKPFTVTALRTAAAAMFEEKLLAPR